MAPKTSDEERKRRKKDYDRRRREKMKNNSVLVEELKLKEKPKYEAKLKAKQRKLVSNMSKREHRMMQKKLKVLSKTRYDKNKQQTDTLISPREACSTSQTTSQISVKIKHLVNLGKKKPSSTGRKGKQKSKL